MNGHILETLTGIGILFNWLVLIKLICRINVTLWTSFIGCGLFNETLLTIPSQAPICYKRHVRQYGHSWHIKHCTLPKYFFFFLVLENYDVYILVVSFQNFPPHILEYTVLGFNENMNDMDESNFSLVTKWNYRF